MAVKKYTLVIMPSSPGKRVIRLCLPSIWWQLFLLTVAGVLFWACLGTWSLFQHKQMSRQALLLSEENRRTRIRLIEKRKKVNYLNKQLKRIQEQTAFIRNFLGLEPLGKTKGMMGQGGVTVSPQAFSLHSDIFFREKAGLQNAVESPPESCLTAEEMNQLKGDIDRIRSTLENKRDEMKCTPSISPVDPRKSWISSMFGIRVNPFTEKQEFHLGIDIAGWKGTPILSPAYGKVIFVGKRGALGLLVKIRHKSVYVTEYGHLQRAAAKKGQLVKRGEVIGFIGNSGRSTGYHVHYGIKKQGKHVNPFPYMMDWGKNNLLLASGDGKTGTN